MAVYSATRIETWRQCELKYCAYYLLGFRERSSLDTPVLALGKLVHRYFEEFYREPQKVQKFKLNLRKLSTWKDEFSKDWDDLESKQLNDLPEDRAFLEQGILALENFYEYEKSRDFKLPIFLEKDFLLDLGQFKIKGKIDRIDRESDGSLTVWDYKISRSVKSKFEINKDLQLTIYYLACKEFFLGEFPKKLGFYYPIQGERISSTRSNKEVNQLESLLLEIDLEVQERGENPEKYFTSPSSWKCNSCNYQEFCPEHKSLDLKELPDLEEILEKTDQFARLKKEEKILKDQLELLKEEIGAYFKSQKIKELGKCKISKRENIEYDLIKLWEVLKKHPSGSSLVKINRKSLEEELESFSPEEQVKIREAKIYKEPIYSLGVRKEKKEKK